MDGGGQPGSSRRLEDAGRAGAAALIGLWGWLVVGFQDPVEPYDHGLWPAGTLAAVFVLGFAGGLVGRGAPGLAGVAAGSAGAVALQLFVLTGQASWTPAVASSLMGDAWLPTMAGALAIGFAAIGLGWATGTAALAVSRHRRPSSPPLWAPLVVAAALALVGLLLVDASSSPYVPAAGEPTLTVAYRDRTVTVQPAVVPAGRATIVGPAPAIGDPWLGLTWPLSGEEQAAIATGRLTVSTMAGATGTVRSDLTPGTHAVVAIPADWTPPPDWDGSQPLLAWTFLTVTPAVGLGPARGEGGRVQVAAFLIALAVQGAAMFALVAWLIPRRKGAEGIPIAVPALAAGVTTVLLGGLALLAVDLAHNPF